jgi:hypothetical protein
MNQDVRSYVSTRLAHRVALNSFRFTLPDRKRNPLPPQHMHFRDTLNPNVVLAQASATELSASHPPSAPRHREKSQSTRDLTGLSTKGMTSLPLDHTRSTAEWELCNVSQQLLGRPSRTPIIPILPINLALLRPVPPQAAHGGPARRQLAVLRQPHPRRLP